MRPVPAGRQRGQCCTPYSRLQEEIDNVETIAVTANNTANNAANAANTAVNTANSAASDAADALAGLTDGSVTQIGTSNVGTDTKPIKLVGGVPTIVANDLVDTATAQTIGGEKTFSQGVNFTNVNIKTSRINGYIGGINFRNANNDIVAQINSHLDGTFSLYPVLGSVCSAQITNQRAYNPANTKDIATIGTLDAYTPMVRTTGNQTIAGNKTLTDRLYLQHYNPEISLQNGNNIGVNLKLNDNYNAAPASNKTAGLYIRDSQGNNEGKIEFIHLTDGSKKIRLTLLSNTGTNNEIDLITVANDGTVTYPWS